MKWNSLFDKSEWLFRQLLNKEEEIPCEDSSLKDLARKLSDDQYLHKRIEEQERFDYLKAYHKNIVTSKKVIISSYLKIACILLLLIGSGTFLYIWQKQNTPQYGNEMYFTDIHPGKQQALLITHDGQKVKLNRDSGQIIRQDGTIIQIDTTGLHYTPSAQVPTGIIYNTLVIPRGGEFFLTLSDGTKVWLNSRSYLKHPTRFTGNTRDVVLNGEAYFSVHKDKSKRFTVSTPFDIKAEVLGTEFNMEAYAADSSVRTTLVSGSIRLSFLDDNQKHKSFLMKPNEEFTYNQYTKKVKVDKPYIPTQTSWKDGLVVFRNTPFNEALKVLSKRFNVEFIVKNDKLYNNSFTGPFDGQHLQLILEHFRLASGIQYRFIDTTRKRRTE